ncbi:MAG: cobyric acid synthase [Alphaproteobacteria bacterium]|nr:cobyric acid synthase [Alphaproteobacteria bacterium]
MLSLMMQGTGSDVGKSLLVTGLARAFTRRGLRVRPFKPQNMSNNAAVTEEGGEIGRAQALQARACGIPPSTEMNPVLLKPQSDGTAQLVVSGRVHSALSARDYRALAPSLLPQVLAAFRRLSAVADLVLVEGAGSPAEVNLRQGDIANMGFAEAVDVPVALVGDIERGGVIAQLVGTHALLSASEQARLAGYIVNKFRGDPRLFEGGIAAIGERTGLACLGVVPYFPDASLLPAEDSMSLSRTVRERGVGRSSTPAEGGQIKIAVPWFPRIANFDDLDPLRAEPGVELVMVRPGRPLPRDAALIILPGSKATLADLAFLREQGWDMDLIAHYRQGAHILGICGGYQMLGRHVADPDGTEGLPGEMPGLGLLDIGTVLGGDKRLAQVSGRDVLSGMSVQGYEMHLGVTTGPGLARPMLNLDRRPDGAINDDGRVMGCYLHCLFTSDAFRHAFLARLGAAPGVIEYGPMIETALDSLADHLERHLDISALLAAARPPRLTRAA